MKYRLSDIAKICGGRLCGMDCEVSGIETDSRNCAFGKDVMFVAMRGANHDSHNFVAEMYERGVRAFMCEGECKCGESAGCVVVENSVTALQRLAEAHRENITGRVVGITGSNGKTVVKEWIAQCLPAGVKLFRSPRSYNSQLGVALSLLMAEGDEELVIIEAGISRPGEMERLERMIRPEVVVVTSLGDAHQEGFESLMQKIDEKLVLAKRAKTIVYHSAYSEVDHAVRRVEAERVDAAKMPEVEFADDASCRNAQIIEALFEVLGYAMPDFANLQPVAMRLEVKEAINGSLLVNDAYNSDINSLAIALDYLHSVAGGRRKVLVLSDILQSGMSDEELYARVARLAAESGVERLIGVGERISSCKSMFVDVESDFYASTDELLRRMNGRDFADAAILLKGNRASRFEKISHALERKSHTTVLEVDLDAMIHNLNYFRSHLQPATRLTAMVKAASYGAGDAEVAQMLQHQGVDYLAVAFADEGVLLREKGVTMPIVVLNADEDSFDQMVLNRLEPEIYSLRSLEAFVGAVRRYGERHFPVHIKLDTGMHRLGFTAEDVDELIAKLADYATDVRVATIFAHLSCADDPSQDDFTRLQISRFDSVSSLIANALPYSVVRHTANSAAIERFPEAQFDMCRLGLGLYGFGYEHNDSLVPASTLKTRIVQIKRHRAGEGIGYGRAERLERDSVVATIPVGYADGLDRHLGCGVWSMLVGGVKAPIVGRVCMDSCMIDVTDVPNVAEGDEVTVFSSIAGNTAEDMAILLGTIPYEVLTSVSGRVKRIYVKE
ncbi:MAG: alanine racemase [Alistipes sp.]|nr:alanine racemase [Alistipes sp.]